MSGLPAEEQYSSWTPALARILGKTLNVSPYRVQHYIRGYLASIGTGLMMGTDSILRSAGGYEKSPSGVITDYIPLIGDGPNKNTKYVTKFYKLYKELDSVTRTFNFYKKTDRIDEARSFAGKHLAELKAKRPANAYKKRLSEISREIERINRDRDLSPTDKRTRIKELTKEKNNIALRGYSVIRQSSGK